MRPGVPSLPSPDFLAQIHHAGSLFAEAVFQGPDNLEHDLFGSLDHSGLVAVGVLLESIMRHSLGFYTEAVPPADPLADRRTAFGYRLGIAEPIERLAFALQRAEREALRARVRSLASHSQDTAAYRRAVEDLQHAETAMGTDPWGSFLDWTDSRSPWVQTGKRPGALAAGLAYLPPVTAIPRARLGQWTELPAPEDRHLAGNRQFARALSRETGPPPGDHPAERAIKLESDFGAGHPAVVGARLRARARLLRRIGLEGGAGVPLAGPAAGSAGPEPGLDSGSDSEREAGEAAAGLDPSGARLHFGPMRPMGSVVDVDSSDEETLSQHFIPSLDAIALLSDESDVPGPGGADGRWLGDGDDGYGEDGDDEYIDRDDSEPEPDDEAGAGLSAGSLSEGSSSDSGRRGLDGHSASDDHSLSDSSDGD